jgi:hypothetical protein
MAVLYANNATTTLAASITGAATSFSVASGKGALFPTISGSDYFYVTLANAAGTIEIVKVTARVTDTFTVVRGQDGTAASAWAAGDKVDLRITKAMLDDLKGERLSLSGGTLTGNVSSTSGMTAWNTTTPGTGVGNYHIGAASATDLAGGAITFGARDASAGANAQAGIYITSGGSFGTRMYLATTDSYALGAKVAVSINEAGTVNITRGALQQGGYQVLHANNYTSYSPSLTGTGASGSWGISITGSAGSAATATSATSASTSTTQAKSDTSNNIATTAFTKQLFSSPSTAGTLDWNDVSNTRPGAGATLLLGTATNGPGGGNYYIPFNYEYNSYDGTGNVTQTAIAYGSPGNELWMRGRYSGSWSSWVRFLNSSNYNSYSPTLTGTGASGSWGISITGSAASITGTYGGTLTSTQVTNALGYTPYNSTNPSGYITASSSITGYSYGISVLDTDRTIANRLPTSTGQSVRFDFANANAVGTGGNYAGVMTFSPWTGTTASTGDASYQLVFGSTAANGSGTPRLRLRNGIDSTWNAWYDVFTWASLAAQNGWTPNVSGGVTRISQSMWAKTGGIDSSWDGQVYSSEAYPTNVYCQASFGNTTGYLMFGLNTLDGTNDTASGYAVIDFAWYGSGGTLQIYESGSAISSYGSYTSSTVLTITYDGSNIRYYKDGTLQRTVARATGNGLYFDSSFYNNNYSSQLYNIEFGRLPQHVLLKSGGTISAPVTINSGTVMPLTLATSSASPWALELLRTDTAFSTKVYNDGSRWYFQHRPSFAGATPLDSSNYNSYSPTLTGGSASGTWSINVTGTAGSISGYNNPTTAATSNTIVYRDSSGHISGNYLFGVYLNASGGNSENPTIGQIWTQNASDNYLRKSTPAHFISQLGLVTSSNIASYAAVNVADGCMQTNNKTISNNYTLGATTNAVSAGPITINTGVTVTISTGATWVVV